MTTLKFVLMTFASMPATQADPAGHSGHTGYIAGAIIALLIMGYLIYTLMRPEKF